VGSFTQAKAAVGASAASIAQPSASDVTASPATATSVSTASSSDGKLIVIIIIIAVAAAVVVAVAVGCWCMFASSSNKPLAADVRANEEPVKDMDPSVELESQIPLPPASILDATVELPPTQIDVVQSDSLESEVPPSSEDGCCGALVFG